MLEYASKITAIDPTAARPAFDEVLGASSPSLPTSSVVLLAHPSLQGISSGSGLSGSTGWHNSVRSRLYLRSPQNEKDEQPDSDLRELQFLKNNYGRLTERVVLRYRNGVFVPEPSMSIIERAAREKQIDDAFLAVLGKIIASNRPVNPSPNASKYAPTVIAGHPDGKAHARQSSASRREIVRPDAIRFNRWLTRWA